MKTLTILFFFVPLSFAAYGQGTVQFSNLSAFGSVNAPVYQSDGITPLSGSQFLAELLAGTTANNLTSIATSGFLTGTAAGFFNGGGVAINNVYPGTVAWVRVDVWNTGFGSTFAQAQASGSPNSWWQSSVFSVTTGGGFQGAPPAALTGLGTSPVYLNSVPEPATTVFLGLGFAVLFLRYSRLK